MQFASPRDPRSVPIVQGRPVFVPDGLDPNNPFEKQQKRLMDLARLKHSEEWQAKSRTDALPAIGGTPRRAAADLAKTRVTRVCTLPGVALTSVGVMGYTGHKPGYSDGTFGVGASFSHSRNHIAKFRKDRGDTQQVIGVMPPATPRGHYY